MAKDKLVFDSRGVREYFRNEQDEFIRIKAIKEVIAWINEHSETSYEHGRGEVVFNHVDWHTFLRENGLEE